MRPDRPLLPVLDAALARAVRKDEVPALMLVGVDGYADVIHAARGLAAAWQRPDVRDALRAAGVPPDALMLADLRRLPVIMLTTSSSARDVAACYDRGVNCYVVNPLDLDDFTALVQAINRFWFEVARLPPE